MELLLYNLFQRSQMKSVPSKNADNQHQNQRLLANINLLVIRDVCSCSDPTRPAADGLLHRVHQRLHACEPRAQIHSQAFGLQNEPDDGLRRGLTIVELAVWLLAVDDVEAVVGAHAHAAHLKVEPLVMVITVDVWIQDQVVLKSVRGERDNWIRWTTTLTINKTVVENADLYAANTHFLTWTAFRRLPDSNCELNRRDSPLSSMTGQLHFETWH